ncbi:MAG: oxalate---CoA ligase [Acidimicrobiaceae bacterium]
MTSDASTVLEVLQGRARRDPQQHALLAPGRQPASNTDVLGHVTNVVQFLRSAGITQTDRVALALPNGPDLATALLGAITAATCAPLAPDQPKAALESQLANLRARVLVVTDVRGGAAREAAAALRIPVLDLELGERAGEFTLRSSTTTSASGVDKGAVADGSLLLFTSGTTSTPKLVPLTEASLLRSAANVAASIELRPTDRCLNVMPLFHIHGIVAALLGSLSAGGSVVCTPGFAATDVLRWVDAFEPTWYTAVPTIHQAMLDAVRRGEREPSWPTLRVIRSSSAALPVRVAAELESVFGVPVIEAYGMTEAAHQMTSNPMPPAMRKAGTVGRPAGPEVAVIDDDRRHLPAGAEGHVVIRGSTVIAGYLDNPAANASDFDNGWFRTGDLGRFDDDGYLTLIGRSKEMINRGGEKLAPREVDDALLEHPEVLHAVAFAIPHPRLGEEAAAAVVLRAQARVTAAELRVFAAERLAPFKVPRRVVVVDEIPRGPSGKLLRTQLADLLGLTELSKAAGSRSRVDPVDDLEAELQELWQRVLGLDEPPSTDAEFFELGGDSLHAVELFEAIEATFGRRLAATLLLTAPTVRDMAAELRAAAPDDTFVTVVAVQPEGSKPPLFCLFRAGSIVATRHLAHGLGREQPVYGLWIPAMHGPPEAAGSIEEIAALGVQAIRTTQPVGPYFLLGHSLGAVVTYEMARQLASDGDRIGLVVIADALHPKVVDARWHRRRSFRYRTRKLFSRRGPAVVAYRVRSMLGLRPPAPPLPPLPGADALVDWAAASERERRYVPGPAPGPVAVLATRAFINAAGSPDLGWADDLAAGWWAHEVPGSHDTMIGEPHVHVLTARLRDSLDRAVASPISSATPSR